MAGGAPSRGWGVHERLKDAKVLNKPALDVIRTEDTPATLFYLDPPYLPDTRTAREVYTHEMSASDHRKLLELLRGVRGKVMLSGYANPLYDGLLHDWARHDFELPNNAAGGAKKRRMIECVWCNFSIEDRNPTPINAGDQQ
jgi:DNA adenine methylase